MGLFQSERNDYDVYLPGYAEMLRSVYTPEQEAAKRRELEQQLYEVFRKYADKRESEEAGT